MEIVKHYRDIKPLRDSFNRLAEATFGLNFENWYHNGFWDENYDPYSVVLDGEVVANVSLNRTEMIIMGQRKHLYQLGTVMTAPEYRNRGYIRAIMEEIEKDTADADGVYLFANDSVLEFYPLFGFRKEREYIYSKTVAQHTQMRMTQVPMNGPEGWAQLKMAIEASRFSTACQMVDTPGLIFFYVSQFLQDCVYHCEVLNTWVIAELEEGELMLHEIFSPHEIGLDDVIQAFGSEIKEVTLGFTPVDTNGFDCREYKEEDCTFFVKGTEFDDFAENTLRIPSLSHA